MENRKLMMNLKNRNTDTIIGIFTIMSPMLHTSELDLFTLKKEALL